MKTIASLICLGILAVGFGGIGNASASPTTFRTPSVRQKAARDMLEKSQAEKRGAEVWAGMNGASTEFVMGGVFYKLIAVRKGRPIYYQTYTDHAAISIGTNLVRNQTPYNLTGEGLTIGLWDATMPIISHQEFQNAPDRITVMNEFASTERHATSIASVLGAAGVEPRAMGMAPLVHIDAHNWETDTSEMAVHGASYPNEPGTIYISNHSYGITMGWLRISNVAWAWLPSQRSAYPNLEIAFGQYDSIAADYDSVAHVAPYFLSFVAAGNDRDDNPKINQMVFLTDDGAKYYFEGLYDGFPKGDGQVKEGYDTLGSNAVAKNVLTVGAVTDAVLDGLRSLEKANVTGFSSWGPADDGRIKPDIVANGDTLYTANGKCITCYSEGVSGTSLACPTASGSAILLVQHYDRLFPGEAMRSSTLKGLLLHSADDLGNPGPDYQTGWGLLNIEAAVLTLDNHANMDAGDRLFEGQLSSSLSTGTYQTECSGADPLRITLCWTDPPSTERTEHDDRTPCLVNDLDLRILGPDGVEVFPFVLDWNTPSAPAHTGDNRVDNIEQVLIPDPAPGTYEVQITYKGSLHKNQQWYSLISSQGLKTQGEITPQSTDWTRQIGTAADDVGNSVAADGRGNVYLAGNTSGSLYGDSAGKMDACIGKYNADGVAIWSHQFGLSGDDSANCIAVDTSGHICVGGFLTANRKYGVSDPTISDGFVYKYDPEGTVLWQQTLKPDPMYGVRYDIEVWGLATDMLNNIYVTGFSEIQIEGSASGGIVFLAKYDADGELQWIRQFGESSRSRGTGIATDPSGNIVVVGKTSEDLAGPIIGGEDTFVIKYDTNGSRLWSTNVGTKSTEEEQDVSIDQEGNIYITGFTWGAFTGTNAGRKDFFIAKLDETGTLNWTRQMGTAYNDGGYGITVDTHGVVYVLGMASGALGNAPYHGAQDIFVGQYDKYGALLGIQQIGGKGMEEGLGISTDPLGNVFITGFTWGTVGRSNFGLKDIVLSNIRDEWY